MNHYKRIFVTGHPGAGKALFAKELANKLGWKFIDADIGLEYRIGQLLPSILGSEGVKHFHACQNKILRLLMKQENIVIATDVSIFCDEINQALLSTEFVLYLKTSSSVQLERIARNDNPLLLTSDLKSFFDDLHKDRDSLLEKTATFTINGDDSDIEKQLSITIDKLHKNIEKTQSASKIKVDRRDMVLFHKSTHAPVFLPEHQAICLKLLGQGKSSKEIARDMNISYRTVEGYLANIMEACGCTSSKELISLYLDQP